MKKVIAGANIKTATWQMSKLEDAKPGVLVVTINEKETNSTINEITPALQNRSSRLRRR